MIEIEATSEPMSRGKTLFGKFHHFIKELHDEDHAVKELLSNDRRQWSVFTLFK